MPVKPKRFIAVGCSHGSHASPEMLGQVVGFTDKFKPHRRVHLGDWCDFAALRTGAKDCADAAESIPDDLEAGFHFLREYRATDILFGNHEARVFRYLNNATRALEQYAGVKLLGQINDFANAQRAQIYQSYSIVDPKSQLWLGDTAFVHGWMFNESATRDHAEWLGASVVHAHTHRPAIATGRTAAETTGYCVGTLADIPAMNYASGRRATSSWGAAIAYGEYTDDKCYVNLALANNGKFSLPY